jgi:NAD(P)-dependent dehydrogenase (short-subunit alcohol dehydrogenase family)
MAARFAEEGARVEVHEQEPSGSHLFGDLQDADLPKKLIDLTVSRHGRIDCIVNNAAVIVRSDLESTDAALFDCVMAVNVRAPLLLIQAALPHFRSQGGGRVLNIGSVNAYCGSKNLLAYSISKGALMTLTRNLSDAHGAEGIKVNQINVGWTHTEHEDQVMSEAGFPEDWAAELPAARAPGGRIFAPREVAEAAVFMLSDEARLLNGAVLDFAQNAMIGRNPAIDL